MNDNTIHLLFSANRWEGSAEIERMLSSGTTLVSYRGSDRNLINISFHLIVLCMMFERHLAFAFSDLIFNIYILHKVCDRYCYSGVAFSAAKGMDMDWCKACDKGLIAPDCVIYLDMPVEEAAQVSKLQFNLFLLNCFYHDTPAFSRPFNLYENSVL
jgi:dTMP kinase